MFLVRGPHCISGKLINYITGLSVWFTPGLLMGESEAQDYLKRILLFVCLFIPDLLSRDGHWASRPNYYAMNSYSLTATTVVCSGIHLKV